MRGIAIAATWLAMLAGCGGSATHTHASSAADVLSPSSSQDAPIPATGTSMENGATVLDGCRDIRDVHSPEPPTVATRIDQSSEIRIRGPGRR